MKDLDEFIKKAKLIVERRAYEHKSLIERLNNLTVKLISRYERTDNIEDLKEVIRIARQTVELTLNDHLTLIRRLSNLKNNLRH